jgi:hypothetical protein
MYEIIVAQPGEFFGHAAGNWDTTIGDGNSFDSVEDAEATIKQLAEASGADGDEWHVLYAIREIGGSSLVATYDYRDQVTPPASFEGYVLTNHGKVLLQIADPNRFGFVLQDDDQEWPGGIGVAEAWEALEPTDPRITTEDRERLQWILDQEVVGGAA